MTLEITHAFTSAKADGSDSTLVQPSDWNANHEVTMASSRILGRVTGGAGAVEELTADDVWDLLGWVATTATVFQQTTAPTGWTKQTDHNNKALRLVTGSVSTGGTTGFTSVLTSRTIATANLPAHTHSFSATSGSSGALAVTFNRSSWTYNVSTNDTGFTSGGQSALDDVDANNDTITATAASHTHSVSGTTGSTGGATAMDFAVQYVDVIIATKD